MELIWKAERQFCLWTAYPTKVYASHKAFSVAGPMTWNSLTDSLRDPSLSIDIFRRQLKHFCFIIRPCIFSALEIIIFVDALYKSTFTYFYFYLYTLTFTNIK